MDAATTRFIENLLFDTLAVDFHYYEAPMLDITSVDRYLRKGLSNTQAHYDAIMQVLHSAAYGRLYIVTDHFFLSYVILRPFEDRGDIMTIGPYTSNPVGEELLLKIAQRNHLGFSEMESLKSFLYHMPLFDNNMRLIAIINDILAFLNPTHAGLKIEEVALHSVDETEEAYVPKDDFESYVQSVEIRYGLEEELMENVAAGNEVGALVASKRFVSFPFEQRLKDALHEKKVILYGVNTLLRKAAQRGEVHPVYLHELHSKHLRMIERITSFAGLDVQNERMIKAYCKLVQQKSRQQYSPLVRELLNRIEFNINGTLTLSTLSDSLNVSPPYLSSLAKKELGVTLTEYINRYRVAQAAKLLASASAQIRDVAAYVGINDLNYFSKLFRRHMNCTPSEYRKKQREYAVTR